MSSATWREAETRSAAKVQQHLPVTGALWLSLLKFSGGQWNVSTTERDVLLAYGLIQKEDDGTVLSSYGKQVLELAS